MAERKVAANSIFLTIAAIDGTEKTIVCLTQTGYQMARQAIDSTSFCGTEQLPGTKTFTLPFTAQRVLVPDADHTSEAGLFGFIDAGTHVQWTLGAATPVAGDIVITGTGYLNSFSTDNSTNAVPTMTGTIDADSDSVAMVVTA